MPQTHRTQVAIVGAGPAGLLLSHLLHLAGISSIVLERQTREYIEQRIRAGVLEQHVVELLNDTGLGERLGREGLLHHGIHLNFNDTVHRLDFNQLIGRSITVYGQHEVVKDLVAARLEAGADIRFSVADTAIHQVDTDQPAVSFTHDGDSHTIECGFIAGCDGFHGICRPSIPQDLLRIHERIYPFGWLGILAETTPPSDELIYSSHDDGFALYSMRAADVARLYVQCAPDEDIANWPDDRIWQALGERLGSAGGWSLNKGPIIERGITAMRSFVAEPMQHGRLFLAGDAAHIVPPTGAKGMNLAVADVRILSRALETFFASGDEHRLKDYSARCLARVWQAQRFSWWMTSMLHRFDDNDSYGRRLQLAELEYLTSSKAAARSLAENYTGLPFDEG
ncbi:MAG: 4-hydroxybenzoate 3-monooxygenase [Rhizobiales bacterium]|nr:4-hydroxybenzoate 3-monooxygenase [Hyphomicrobiales bacterium]